MTVQRDLAANLLQSVADELEATFRVHRHCNTMLARYAGDATLALGLGGLTPRFVRLLKRSKWEGFFGGIITNARLPWFVPTRLRQLKSIQKIEQDYPLFTADFATKTIATYYPEMIPCIESGFDSLLHAATTDLATEEIALTQAILGRHSDALETSHLLTELDRQNNVRFVIAIEYYRHGRVDEARTMQDTLVDGTLAGWGGAQFALGICNRVPWCPYPYPDY